MSHVPHELSEALPELADRLADYAPGDLNRVFFTTGGGEAVERIEEYRTSVGRKIKQLRTEAVRAGFKHCYDEQDYQTIADVAAKLPEKIIQEDEKLLMYFDVATMRLGEDE